jgi:hypothetical protein
VRKYSGVILACLVLLVGVANADMVSKSIILVDSPSDGSPAFSVLADDAEGLRLEFRLPTLDLEEFTEGGKLFHVLTIKGGGMAGETGEPGLPTITRFVSVPEHATVSARIVSDERQVLEGYRVLPVQPDDAQEFVIDRAYYERSRALTPPALAVGEPAMMRDQRVVPITFSPVSYDPASGKLAIASRMEIAVEFSGSSDRAAPPVRKIPESFDRLFSDTILNYSRGNAEVGPGSYLVLCRNDAAALGALEPLLEWRRRQGYNVVVEILGGEENNSQVKALIQGHYTALDPPLEFVSIVGDATGTYDIPAGSGQGDHNYTTLDGGDILADVHIGRLSCESLADLEEIVDKIVTYETNPPTSDAGWFTRGCVTGDPSSSGITTIYISQWLKRQLLAHGFTQVDTIFGGNFATAMRNSINQGLTAFSYRGYLGMSGLTTASINSLTNGDKLPFAVFPTCDSGTWVSSSDCRSETFIRTPNGGAIGAIGTATTGTHTRYNNCLFHGVWEAAVNGSDNRLGSALTRGKLELYINYINYEPGMVGTFSEWNNLMGDPATNMWTSYPSILDVDHPTTLPVGSNSVPVTVRVDGSPLEGARVCVYKEGQVSITGYTDPSGHVNLPISGHSLGTMLVTVIKHDHFPYLGDFNLGPVSVFAGYDASVIDDDDVGDSSGNGDALLNPAESIEMPVALRNLGNSNAVGVDATLLSDDPFVTITDGFESFGDIPGGGVVWSSEDFDFDLAADAPDGHVVDLDLVASSSFTQWTSLIQLTVRSAAFVIESNIWGGSGDTLDPGESGTLDIEIRNTGSQPGNATIGLLTCDSPWVVVTDDGGSYGDVAVDATASGRFALAISPVCFEGHKASFTLTMQFNGGHEAIVEFEMPVGAASGDDPMGPDTYGYYAFDNSDVAYHMAPVYDWIEIDPNHGGSGTSVGLTDFGYEQDDTEVVALPFTFNYYGQAFDEISICSNGWIAMGVTPLVHWRNWLIPCAGGPNPLIAVFWDDLIQTGNNKVYHYYDQPNSRYIVQWSRMTNQRTEAIENVQVVLFDPATYPTSTGDGEILMQYETVTNNNHDRGNATVGIQNLDGTDGLCYTYASNYEVGAAALVAGRAIRFKPLGDMSMGELRGHISNASNAGSPVGGTFIRVVENNQTLISQGSGDYTGNVSEGIYTIRAEHESFATVTVQDVEIVEDQITLLDFQLTDILGPYILNTTELVFTDDVTGPYIVDTWITDFSAVANARFFFRTNVNGPVELPLTLIEAETGQYRAEIPGQPMNTQIKYWLEAEDSGGNTSRDPEDPWDFHEFWILERVVDFVDDMEADLGWTVGDVDDNATTGLWVRVDPIGVWEGDWEVQPEDDASAVGINCWITGNAETGQQGADDVDGGMTTLLSPWFDMSEAAHADVTYRRWFTNDTGYSPGEDFWTVEVTDDGSNWVQLEWTSASDRSWSLHSFVLEDYIDLTSNVRFRFIATDEGGGSVVEAGVDEFQISGFRAPDLTATEDGSIPLRLTLLPNSPNPFNPETKITFGLPVAQAVTLRVYDTRGRLTRTLLDGNRFDAGFHSLSWDGRDERARSVSSGIYFYLLETESGRVPGKMTLLK